MTWIFGFHPVREALRARGQEVDRVRIGRVRAGERREEIESLCADLGIPIEETDDAWFSSQTDAVHNGFAVELPGAEELAAGSAAAESGLVVLAEDIQDPRNLGALVRVCEACGVDRLLLRDRGSTHADDTVAKTSAGATQYLAPERVTNSSQEIEKLKEQGFWVYGAAGEGVPPWEIDLSGKLALVVGGEQGGLRRLTRERCDGLLGLPMLGRVGSLNLATAAAAILYEVVRQRSGEAGSR